MPYCHLHFVSIFKINISNIFELYIIYINYYDCHLFDLSFLFNFILDSLYFRLSTNVPEWATIQPE